MRVIEAESAPENRYVSPISACKTLRHIWFGDSSFGRRFVS